MKHLKLLALSTVTSVLATVAMGSAIANASTARSGLTALGVGAEIVGSLQEGTSQLLTDKGGLANDTCTSSEFKMKISSITPATNPRGAVSSLTFGGCSHTTTVLANGSLEFKNIAGTTNATVVSSGMRYTVKSTVYGTSCIVNTGAGTTLGTLTGSTIGNAAFDMNGVVALENGCGFSTWTGTYIITSPSGFNFEG